MKDYVIEITRGGNPKIYYIKDLDNYSSDTVADLWNQYWRDQSLYNLYEKGEENDENI